MGIQLQYLGTLEHDDAGRMTFSIRYSDTAPIISTPETALIADFKAISCFINIPSTNDSQSSIFLAQAPHHTFPPSASSHNSMTDLRDEDTYFGVATSDRQCVDSFFSCLSVSKSNTDCLPFGQHNHRSADKVEFMDDMRCILEYGAKVLFLGANSQRECATLLEGQGSQGLKKLAPAVFDVPRLKVLVVSIIRDRQTSHLTLT